ncbi:MAG: acyl-CoA thioesterase [Gemmatimonadota bacterium]|jgi:YbgC/YbaW family acyl-CoA thioester hydrolase|nr:thioesterase family protein [Gemmatimonadota bacterium]
MSVHDETPAPFLQHEWVRWRDVDPVGIMRYDAYLRLLELGEEELVRASRLPLWEGAGAEIWLPRKVVHLEYHAPCRLGDRLALASYIGRLGTSSLTLHLDVLTADGARVLAEAHMVVVAASRDGRLAKVPLPEAIRVAAAPWTLPPAEARARAAERLAGDAPAA